MKINLNKTRKNLLFVIVFISFTLLVNWSSNQPPESPETLEKSRMTDMLVHGSYMDSLKLTEIPKVMQQFVNDRKISGVVTLVAHNGQITSFEAVGLQNIEKNIPMQKNTIFRIQSMTKPFVAAAIMMLSEEGKLHPDDPVEKYLPEFCDMWLVSEMTGEKAILIRPSRKITIRDILGHTSGLAGYPANFPPVYSIAEYARVISQRPLQFEPGSQWRYSGPGTNTAASVVEVVSGQPYDIFLSERIFKPLGMTETYFFPPEESLDRIATIYHPSADSSFEVIEPPNWMSFPHPRPAGGLFSTAHDVFKWMQAILNKGIYNETRILTEESVNEMIKIQTGELKIRTTDEMGYGLAFGIVRNPTGVNEMLSPGSFGHGGHYGTQGWADPKTNTIYIVMIHQRLPGGDAHDIRYLLQKIAADAIMKYVK